MTKLFTMLLFLLVACSKSEIKKGAKKEAPKKLNVEEPQTYFQTLEQTSPNTPYAVEILKKSFHKRKNVTRFELRQGEGWRNRKGAVTYRSELSTGLHPEMNSTKSYQCSLFIPKDFPIENNRLVLMQWLPKTKTELGEMPRSPALALRFVDGELYLAMRTSDERVITEPENVPSKILFSTTKKVLNRWHDFKFKVKWSYREDGLVEVRLNGKKVVDYQGPVGYNDDVAPSFRYGIYREDSLKTYVAYFSNCRENF